MEGAESSAPWTERRQKSLDWIGLSNTYETLPLLLKFIREQESGKFFVKFISCCHGNQFFDAMFSQILTFLIFFLLINNFFKINVNFLSQSQEIDISS